MFSPIVSFQPCMRVVYHGCSMGLVCITTYERFDGRVKLVRIGQSSFSCSLSSAMSLLDFLLWCLLEDVVGVVGSAFVVLGLAEE
jgi:hypothetical protein